MDFVGFEFKETSGRRRKASGGGSGYASCDEYGIKQRSQANARERDRTHRSSVLLTKTVRQQQEPQHVQQRQNVSVNSAFSTLRTLIPTEPRDRKLSKIETLRLASSYISHLGTQLVAGPVDQPCLRLARPNLDQDGGGRNQVCTFCIAHKKTPKTPALNEEYICQTSSMDGQLFYAHYSAIPETTLLSNGDLNHIYYQ